MFPFYSKESLRPTLSYVMAHSEVTLTLLYARIQILNKQRKLGNHCAALDLKLRTLKDFNFREERKRCAFSHHARKKSGTHSDSLQIKH